MSDLYYRVVISLEEVTQSPPGDNGYIRENAKALSSITLTGSTELNVVDQARRHVDVLVTSYTPVKAAKGGYQ